MPRPGYDSSMSAERNMPAEPPAPRRGCGSFVLGGILVLIGIPMLVCPGPGIASILAGLGLMGFGTARRMAEKDPDAHP